MFSGKAITIFSGLILLFALKSPVLAQDTQAAASADVQKLCHECEKEILEKLSKGVSDGIINAKRSTEFEDRLNALVAAESPYLSPNHTVTPLEQDAILSKLRSLDADVVSALNEKIRPAPNLTTLEIAVHKLISKGLTSGVFTAVESNAFYAKLAEIGADYDSVREAEGGISDEDGKRISSSLNELKDEVTARLKGRSKKAKSSD